MQISTLLINLKNQEINSNLIQIQIIPQYLIKRHENNFKFKLIDDAGVRELIKRAISTNLLGNDIISMKILKKLSPHILPYIHLIIITRRYPLTYKVSQKTPFLKPEKLSSYIASYRTINNLSQIENTSKTL